MSDVWSAVSAIAAVLSVAGGCVAWWRSTVSRKARDDAREERKRAERAVAAAETHAEHAGAAVDHLEGLRREAGSQSASLEKLAEASGESPFRVEFVKGQMYRLLNRTNRDARIECVVNRRSFAVLRDLGDGTEVPARNGVNFRMMAANGSPLPATLILDIEGEDAQVYVDLPVKPRT